METITNNGSGIDSMQEAYIAYKLGNGSAIDDSAVARAMELALAS